MEGQTMSLEQPERFEAIMALARNAGREAVAEAEAQADIINQIKVELTFYANGGVAVHVAAFYVPQVRERLSAILTPEHPHYNELHAIPFMGAVEDDFDVYDAMQSIAGRASVARNLLSEGGND